MTSDAAAREAIVSIFSSNVPHDDALVPGALQDKRSRLWSGQAMAVIQAHLSFERPLSTSISPIISPRFSHRLPSSGAPRQLFPGVKKEALESEEHKSQTNARTGKPLSRAEGRPAARVPANFRDLQTTAVLRF